MNDNDPTHKPNRPRRSDVQRAQVTAQRLVAAAQAWLACGEPGSAEDSRWQGVVRESENVLAALTQGLLTHRGFTASSAPTSRLEYVVQQGPAPRWRDLHPVHASHVEALAHAEAVDECETRIVLRWVRAYECEVPMTAGLPASAGPGAEPE